MSVCRETTRDGKSSICDIVAGLRIVAEGSVLDLCLPCAATCNWLLKYKIDSVRFYADYSEHVAAHAGEIKARAGLPELKRDSQAEDERNPLASLKENDWIGRVLEASSRLGTPVTLYRSDYPFTPFGHVGAKRRSGATGRVYPDIGDDGHH